ncbi:MAG: TatD family hydrolase [Roseburia sp.]|nr:TatD family hydrolase [Roseburia sp.]
MLIDSHAHIYDEQYGDGGKSIIASMASDGLEAIISVGCDLASSRECVRLADCNDGIFATVGVHPYYPEEVSADGLDELRRLASHKKTVAIGEFGLDFHRDDFDKPAQIAALNAQYELARELCLPMMFHVREAAGEFYDFLKDRNFPQSGVMHCFSGSVETAKYCVRKGLYLAFGGKLTYNNAKNLAAAAKETPLDRILLETDAPYLSPSKFLGQINYPKNVALVRDRLAEIKGVSPEIIERATTENVKRLFFRMTEK